MHAQPRIRHKRSGPGVGAPHDRDPNHVHFHFAFEFSTQTLAGMLDSLVRVSRRVGSSHYASILSTFTWDVTPTFRRAEFLNPNRHMQLEAITHPKMPHSPGLYLTVKIDADPSTRK
jgi:hypothetical protein